jgi:hypothetical protein
MKKKHFSAQFSAHFRLMCVIVPFKGLVTRNAIKVSHKIVQKTITETVKAFDQTCINKVMNKIELISFNFSIFLILEIQI